jgi:predicted kinase
MAKRFSEKQMKKIIAVCGPVCCGKTTWCNERIGDAPNSYIKVSNIVKAISKAQTREELQNTKHLDMQIAEQLLRQVDSLLELSDVVYIDGIRQLSIYLYLKRYYPTIELVWVEVPYTEREQRYNSRADSRDSGISFEQANKQDFELGLTYIKNYYHSTQIID